MRHARDHLQRRALPCAVAAEKSHGLALLDFERKVLAGIDASQERALAVVVEDAQETPAIVLVQVVRLGHMIELDYHFVAHAGFMKGLGILQRLVVRGHRTPPH